MPARLSVIEAGVPTIWAKATNERHGKILKGIGVKNVVYPEARMGQMVAHILTGKMMDFVELDDDFAMVKTRVPADHVGLTLQEAQLQHRHGVPVVGVKRPGKPFIHAQPGITLKRDDLLIVIGETRTALRDIHMNP